MFVLVGRPELDERGKQECRWFLLADRILTVALLLQYCVRRRRRRLQHYILWLNGAS